MLYQNEAADQALLQVYDENGQMLETPHYLRLLPESRLRTLEPTWSLGFPGGNTQAARGDNPEVQIEKGNITSLPRTPGGRLRMIYTDALVRPGNSGGPCVDRDGFLVGTVTLMKPPEGREDTGGGRYSALVPATLTAEMVRNAFLLGKIAEGTDFTPFMESITERSGLVNVPAYQRRGEQDVLFFDNGDRYYGQIETERIGWSSPLGDLEVPADAVAYVMHNADGFDLFLEGGNRLSGKPIEESFKFKEQAGGEYTVAFKDVSVVAFRTAGRNVTTGDRETLVFDTNVCHLVIGSVEGKAPFANRLGKRDVSLKSIDRIETNPGGDQVVTLVNGARITGKFDPSPMRVALAGLDVELPINLAAIDRAAIERREVAGARLGGLELRQLMAEARPEIRAIEETLRDDPSAASAKLTEWMEKTDFRRLPDIDQDRLRVLSGLAAVRLGNPDAAVKQFRTASRSGDLNLAAFASAHLEVIKTFSDFKFDGQPLSDPAAFARAAQKVAQDHMQETRDFLRDARMSGIERKGDFRRLLTKAGRYEDKMRVAAVLAGPVAEDLLIRVWKTMVDAGVEEIIRLYEEEQENNRFARGGGRRDGFDIRSLDRIEEAQEVLEELNKYVYKRYDYGFHIEDPDIDRIREQRAGLAGP